MQAGSNGPTVFRPGSTKLCFKLKGVPAQYAWVCGGTGWMWITDIPMGSCVDWHAGDAILRFLREGPEMTLTFWSVRLLT